MLDHLKNLFANNNQPSKANRLALDWQKKAKQLLRDLSQSRDKMELLQSEMRTLEMRIERQVKEAEQTEQQHRTVVEALQSENQVKDITIETLTGQHKLIQQRIEEEVAVSVMRQTAVKLRNTEGD